jgi:hypothetical protein
MQNRCAISVSAGLATLVVIFSACIGRACTIVPETVEVGTEFQVKVTDRGRPVTGLRLVLSSSGWPGTQTKVVTVSFTNSDGYAHFSNLNMGSFWLASDHDAGIGDAVVVNVSPNGPANKILLLRWPSREPLTVRSASGILRGPDYYPAQVQGLFSISLLEGILGREIETTRSDRIGRFSFATEIPRGIYFLRVNPSGLSGWSGEQIEGMIAIEVTHEAMQGALDLDIGWTSCGLSYAQRGIYPELKLDKICGAVTDSEGAVVSNAQVTLLADGEDPKILEQTRSGTSGQFALLDPPDGTYQLLIKSPGFRPFLRLIRVQHIGKSGSCQQPLPIRLDVMF